MHLCHFCSMITWGKISGIISVEFTGGGPGVGSTFCFVDIVIGVTFTGYLISVTLCRACQGEKNRSRKGNPSHKITKLARLSQTQAVPIEPGTQDCIPICCKGISHRRSHRQIFTQHHCLLIFMFLVTHGEMILQVPKQ